MLLVLNILGVLNAAPVGTAVATYYDSRTAQCVAFEWQSSTNQTATLTSKALSGELGRVVFVNGTTTNAPLVGYGITITDVSGLDILCGAGSTLTNTDTTVVGFTANKLPVLFDGKLIFGVTGAGTNKTGTVYLFYR